MEEKNLNNFGTALQRGGERKSTKLENTCKYKGKKPRTVCNSTEISRIPFHQAITHKIAEKKMFFAQKKNALKKTKQGRFLVDFHEKEKE